eukprot:4047138-Prymnesium_polylepis.1
MQRPIGRVTLEAAESPRAVSAIGGRPLRKHNRPPHKEAHARQPTATTGDGKDSSWSKRARTIPVWPPPTTATRSAGPTSERSFLSCSASSTGSTRTAGPAASAAAAHRLGCSSGGTGSGAPPLASTTASAVTTDPPAAAVHSPSAVRCSALTLPCSGSTSRCSRRKPVRPRKTSAHAPRPTQPNSAGSGLQASCRAPARIEWSAARGSPVGTP